MKKCYLTICRCPIHGLYSISIDDDEKGGLQLTPDKCCGRWESLTKWSMTSAQLRSIAMELECNADQLDHENN